MTCTARVSEVIRRVIDAAIAAPRSATSSTHTRTAAMIARRAGLVAAIIWS